MQYILFIHNNADTAANSEQWTSFFEAAEQSGLFRGGSEIAHQTQIGVKPVTPVTKSIGGFMLFETDDKEPLLALLEQHPVALQGGTLELCEMPKSDS